MDLNKNESFRERQSRLGRKGGLKSKRKLSTQEAKKMIKKRWSKKNNE